MKKIIKAMVYFSAILLNLYVLTGHAAVFSIVPKAGTTLPTTVPTGGTVKAFYTITNTTSGFHSANYLKYLPLNVAQVTSDTTYPDLCGATFALAANASCTLELNVSGAVNAADPDPRHHLFACLGGCVTCCAGTKYPLNVQVSPTPPPPTPAPNVTAINPVNASTNVPEATNISVTFSVSMSTATLIPANFQLYDTNTSTYTTLLNPVYSNTNMTVTFSTSSPLNAGDTYQIIIPQASNVKSAAGVALVSGGILGSFTVANWSPNDCNQVWVLNNTNNSITNCYYDDTSGAFNTCTGNGLGTGTNLSSPTAMWWDPVYGLSITNGSGSDPFIRVADASVVVFPPTTPPYTGTPIASSNATNPVGVASLNGVGWIANGNGTLTYCTTAPYNGIPNTWSGCSVMSGPTGYSPNATNLNIARATGGTNAVLYTANTNSNSISLCIIDNMNTISTCSNAGGSGFNKPTSVSAAIQFATTPYALVTNSGNNTVLLCSIDSSTFVLSNCISTGSNFNQPSYVFEANNFAYITNAGDNSVTVCNDNNGVLTNCNSMPYGFSKPVSITLQNMCI